MDYLLFAVAAVLLLYFGYKRMDALGTFLEQNSRTRTQQQKKNNRLCIGFETPAIAEHVADTLSNFCRRHQNCELSFVSGSAQQIREGLNGSAIDVGLVLLGSGERPSGSVVIPLCCSEVFSRELDQSIEPLDERLYAVVMMDQGELCSEKYELMNALLETFRSEERAYNNTYRKSIG